MSSLNALLYRLKCMSIYHTCKFWNKEQFSQTTSMLYIGGNCKHCMLSIMHDSILCSAVLNSFLKIICKNHFIRLQSRIPPFILSLQTRSQVNYLSPTGAFGSSWLPETILEEILTAVWLVTRLSFRQSEPREI